MMRLLAELPKGCLQRAEMARELVDLRKMHTGRFTLFSNPASSLSSVTSTAQGSSIDLSVLKRLGTYLELVKRSKAVLGSVVHGNTCYEASLGRFSIKLSEPSISLDFVVSTRRVLCDPSSPITKRSNDHERAAMERAINQLQQLVAGNIGGIGWKRLEETDGAPLPDDIPNSYWDPTVVPNIFPKGYSVIVPIRPRVSFL